jgi:hypothetical protein
MQNRTQETDPHLGPEAQNSPVAEMPLTWLFLAVVAVLGIVCAVVG